MPRARRASMEAMMFSDLFDCNNRTVIMLSKLIAKRLLQGLLSREGGCENCKGINLPWDNKTRLRYRMNMHTTCIHRNLDGSASSE